MRIFEKRTFGFPVNWGGAMGYECEWGVADLAP